MRTLKVLERIRKETVLAVFALVFVATTLSTLPSPAAELRNRSQSYKVRFGDSIQKILERHGFTKKDVQCLRSKGHFKELPEIMAEELYLVQTGQKNFKNTVRFYEDNGQWADSFWRSPADCGYVRHPVQWEIKTIEKKGRFIGSIHNTFGDIFGDHRMITKFMDAFRFCCDLARDIRRGDTYHVKFERLFDSGVFIRYGEIQYAKITHAEKVYERQFVTLPGGGTYIGEDLVTREVPFYLPVSYFHVSSVFQNRRFHPVKKRTLAHLGVDFPLPTGSPVYASRDGVIKKIGKNRASGNYVVIDHGDGYLSKYLHLSEIDKSLKTKKKVSAGKDIGKIGCTGYCTKPHLHFAIKKGRRYIDPLTVMRSYPAHHEDEVLQRLQ